MGTNEFTVESMKHCFICLNQVSSHFPVDPKTDSDLQSFSIHSLWSLSSYLKMDMGKVFHDNDSIPQHLFDKVRKSKLKGELCDECAVMNNKFSELYWKLVKTEMELVSSLQLFQSKLLAANRTGKSTALLNHVTSMVTSSDLTEKLGILEVLRAEAIRKCSDKLNGNDAPRIKIQNLTMHQVTEEKKKFREHSSVVIPPNSNVEDPAPDIEYRNVKTEYPFEDPMPNEIDIDDSYYSDRDNSDNMDSSNADEKSSTSLINEGARKTGKPFVKVEGSTSTGHSRKIRNEKVYRNTEYGKDLNVNYPCEVVIPTESCTVGKPQPINDPESGKHKCNLCPSEFVHRADFNRHYESIHLKVRYKCSICGRQFSERSKCNRHHRNIHLGIRFKCLQCNKIFKQRFELTAHQRKHE